MFDEYQAVSSLSLFFHTNFDLYCFPHTSIHFKSHIKKVTNSKIPLDKDIGTDEVEELRG